MIVNKPKKRKNRKGISRFTILKIIMGIIFALICGRLIYLQVFEHKYFKQIANENATRFIPEPAPRGEILDNQGNILATNKDIYNLTYTMPSVGQVNFYGTMNEVFKIIASNNDQLINTMLLKMDNNGNFYYAFNSDVESAKQYEQIRFLRDIGMNEVIQTKLYGDQLQSMSQQQTDAINQKLLKVTPEQAFDYLIKTYNLIGLICPQPVQTNQNPTHEERDEFETKMNTYNAEMKKYNNMTGKEQLAILNKAGYSNSQLLKYIIVKDEIRMQSFKGYRTVNIAQDVSKKTAFEVYQELDNLPGVNVQLDPVRYYPYGNLASAVLGYLTPISSSEQAQYELRGYDVNTALVGASGIEEAYQDYLRGVTGGETVKVDAQGRTTAVLDKINPYPGDNVHLTINKNIQYAVDQGLKDTMAYVRAHVHDYMDGYNYPNATRGAAIVVNVHTGAIVAMSSYPNFNPNLFAVPGKLTKAQFDEYFAPDLAKFGQKIEKMPGVKMSINQLFPKGPDGQREDKYNLYPKPFYNYATMGAIPPGSIFKPLTATAALQSGVFAPNETYYAKGWFSDPKVFGPAFKPEGWLYKESGGQWGDITLPKALEVSSDVFFYDMGFRLYQQGLQQAEAKHMSSQDAQIYALNALARWAWKFGLGHPPNVETDTPTGIEIPENNYGQTYDFQSFKADQLLYAKFNLNDYLTSGTYMGIYNFAPLSLATNPGDSKEVIELKEKIKDMFQDRLEAVGTSKPQPGFQAFADEIAPYVEKLLNTDQTFKTSFANYKKSHPNATMKQQYDSITAAIAQFAVRNVASQMFSPAQVVYAAIGQGINHFTPIQLASYITALANGGTRYRLHLVSEVTTPTGKVIEKTEPQVIDKIPMKQSTIDTVHAGMRLVTTAPQGTATNVFGNFPIAVAGKTGTADYSDNERMYGRAPYSTFIGFAPYKDPEYAVMTVIYDGANADMVAKAAFEACFAKQLKAMHYKSPTFTKYVLDAPQDNYPGYKPPAKKDNNSTDKSNNNSNKKAQN